MRDEDSVQVSLQERIIYIIVLGIHRLNIHIIIQQIHFKAMFLFSQRMEFYWKPIVKRVIKSDTFKSDSSLK